MLQRFEIQGVHMTVDDKLRAYVTKKIGGLDRYVSRHVRQSAHCEVHLKESKAKQHDHCACEVTLHLPHQNIIIKERALNMYAAVDIVEAKLKLQLKKYKDTHGSGKTRRHLFARLRRNGN
ncbi:MAG: ribosome-associated translation inhibitor RaiA [Candidatus Saccharimonadales bacterium]